MGWCCWVFPLVAFVCLCPTITNTAISWFTVFLHFTHIKWPFSKFYLIAIKWKWIILCDETWLDLLSVFVVKATNFSTCSVLLNICIKNYSLITDNGAQGLYIWNAGCLRRSVMFKWLAYIQFCIERGCAVTIYHLHFHQKGWSTLFIMFFLYLEE